MLNKIIYGKPLPFGASQPVGGLCYWFIYIQLITGQSANQIAGQSDIEL